VRFYLAFQHSRTKQHMIRVQMNQNQHVVFVVVGFHGYIGIFTVATRLIKYYDHRDPSDPKNRTNAAFEKNAQAFHTASKRCFFRRVVGIFASM
jgi:hypothetical protein